MYAPFFGLKQEPFSIAPDPRFLYMSGMHREALAHLLYGLQAGGGFVLLTGEIGAGKTTVCRCFLEQLPAQCDVAYIFNPRLSVTELLQTVCEEFHIELPAGAATIKDFVDPLNGFLLRAHAAGRHSVLIIDEAQNLSAEVLEQLRLLTNLETAERKLLQIILIGQPELRAVMARPELEQLAQRVIARYHLAALTEAQTQQYVRHRLAVAGLGGELPFDAGALRRIHRICAGVPRRINLLADRALLGGYASARTRIDRRIVDRAAQEVFGDAAPAGPRRWALATALLGVGVVLGAGAAVLAWQRSAVQPTVGAAPSAASAASASVSAYLPASTPASASLSTMPATSPASAPDIVRSADRDAVLAQAWTTEASAWQALAPLWQLPAGDGDACKAAARQHVYCLRVNTGLAQLRELGRPGILTLRGTQDHALYALLVGLDGAHAHLAFGGDPVQVPMHVLATLWRGDFATLWLAPPAYHEPLTATHAAALTEWVAAQLPAAASAPGQTLRARLQAFQVAHGLKPDGLAGPMTLMQINRAAGVLEPRLNPGR